MIGFLRDQVSKNTKTSSCSYHLHNFPLFSSLTCIVSRTVNVGKDNADDGTYATKAGKSESFRLLPLNVISPELNLFLPANVSSNAVFPFPEKQQINLPNKNKKRCDISSSVSIRVCHHPQTVHLYPQLSILTPKVIKQPYKINKESHDICLSNSKGNGT